MAACGELKPVEFTRKPTTTVEQQLDLDEDDLTATTLPNLRPARYEVEPGDTIGSIATRFGLTIDALLVANQLTDPNQLEAGSILRIPGPNTTTPPPWLQRENPNRTR